MGPRSKGQRAIVFGLCFRGMAPEELQRYRWCPHICGLPHHFSYLRGSV